MIVGSTQQTVAVVMKPDSPDLPVESGLELGKEVKDREEEEAEGEACSAFVEL